MMKKLLISLLFTITSLPLIAQPFLNAEKKILWQRIKDNITHHGRVMASPSQHHPDYYYHWVRDAALTMSLLKDNYAVTQDPTIENILKQYALSAQIHQNQPAINNIDPLGEPKFYLDGSVYDKPWGRSQNDGSALRAITLMQFAKLLPNTESNIKFISQVLYQANLSNQSMGVIKKDLEYIAHHHQEFDFDLWEETYGQHFFTKMVQRQALLMGAEFALQKNDPLAAQFYVTQANNIEKTLTEFFDHNTKTIKAHLDGSRGPNKTDNVDMSILLGYIYGRPITSISKEQQQQYLANSLTKLQKHFTDEYPINQATEVVLFGRYPKDTYDGYETNQLGNPWFILSATMAEYYYLQSQPQKGDRILARLKSLAKNLHFHEQINRKSGKGQGAYDLTWSYVATLHALNTRLKLYGE